MSCNGPVDGIDDKNAIIYYVVSVVYPSTGSSLTGPCYAVKGMSAKAVEGRNEFLRVKQGWVKLIEINLSPA